MDKAILSKWEKYVQLALQKGKKRYGHHRATRFVDKKRQELPSRDMAKPLNPHRQSGWLSVA